MIFALGFLMAGLLALIGLPALWRRALRLTRRRLEMQLPLSPAEIVAERDQVRAEAAVEIRRAEQRIERMTVEQAANGAELGRRAAEIARLRELAERQDARIAAVEAEISARTFELNEATGERGALQQALHAVDDLLRNEQAQFGALSDRHRRVSDLSLQQQAQIGALSLRVEGLQVRLADLGEDLGAIRTQRDDRILLAENLLEETAFLKHELRVTEQHRENLQQRYAAAAARIGEVEHALTESGAARQRAEEDLARRDADLARERESAEALRERMSGLRERQEQAAMAAQEHERQLADRLEKMRGEKAALESALAVARTARRAPASRQAGDIIPVPAAGTPALAATPAQKRRRMPATPQQTLTRLLNGPDADRADREPAEPQAAEDAQALTR